MTNHSIEVDCQISIQFYSKKEKYLLTILNRQFISMQKEFVFVLYIYKRKEFFFKRKDLVFEELGFDGEEWKATSLLLFEKQYF